jgi:2-dehydro-3-deoxyphosphooctonate aldolase (KDO 8-P synthase)
MTAPVSIGPDVTVGDGRLALIAGPCALESREIAFEVATAARAACERLGVPFVFKASFDKANRTAAGSFRSIGMDAALEILAEVRSALNVPVMTDVHEPWQVALVGEVCDLIQIPAFLCRQTDLLAAAGASGRAVNIKKGQFMAPGDMRFAVEKVRAGGGDGVLLTERGTTFGYHDLVVDFRGLAIMRESAPVVFDATHSVQTPGGAGGRSGGRLDFVEPLARAAAGFGIDALFLETHPCPAEARSDADSQVPLAELEGLVERVAAIHAARGLVPA